MTNVADERQVKLEVELAHLQKDMCKFETICDHCIVRKIVYAVVGLIGLGFIGAIMTLVLRR
jgi:hypothetical protein